jgi:hypothetical protein
MTHLIHFLLAFITSSARSRLSLQLEIATLRHQLSAYRAERRKPRSSLADRLLCVDLHRDVNQKQHIFALGIDPSTVAWLFDSIAPSRIRRGQF